MISKYRVILNCEGLEIDSILLDTKEEALKVAKQGMELYRAETYHIEEVIENQGKLTREELYAEFTLLQSEVQKLSGVVQNEGVTEQDLSYFNEDVNKVMNKLNALKLDVFEYYNKKLG